MKEIAEETRRIPAVSERLKAAVCVAAWGSKKQTDYRLLICGRPGSSNHEQTLLVRKLMGHSSRLSLATLAIIFPLSAMAQSSDLYVGFSYVRATTDVSGDYGPATATAIVGGTEGNRSSAVYKRLISNIAS
jgi:hypothetical protein